MVRGKSLRDIGIQKEMRHLVGAQRHKVAGIPSEA